jgi:hypothetical protein
MNKETEYFTREQLNIELLKQKNDSFNETLKQIMSHQRWMLGLMGTGFLGLLGLMARGFKWII